MPIFSDDYRRKYDADGHFTDYGLATIFAIRLAMQRKNNTEQVEKDLLLIKEKKEEINERCRLLQS